MCLSSARLGLMAHIPFRRYQTWGLHLATGWTTVAILGYMILVLGAYLLVLNINRDKRNQLPIRPDCIAGVVYYLACDDGEVVRDFQQGLENPDVSQKNDISMESQVGYVFGDDNGTGDNEGERRVAFRRVVL
ncbi:hypothetical protein QBC37DRAFT_434588 [Rhypophila decipiens]|uniref:Uncharacterized protein n=1 Tax=Rhypophila decipiens TaxID=261697 RepID=A0AAN7AZ03_9PEZI|nr:hypothetical protein QBC37DRAFT_434588 [Rhypophila decipiens]